MTANERLRNFQKRLALNHAELALVFGCAEDTVRGWIHDRNRMSYEFESTLNRIDSENVRQLAGKLRRDVVDALNDMRNRGALVKRNIQISQGELTQ